MPLISVITSLYKGEQYLAGFFDNLSEQTIFDQMELLLLHNCPTDAEMAIIEAYRGKMPIEVQHLVIQPVESLSVSWNRGWRGAKGDFVAFWNVDDRRPFDSLEAQVNELRRHPECEMAYGDFITTDSPLERQGWQTITPEFRYEKFLRRMVMGGAFMVFRRDLPERAGFFDEQLRSAMDFDFYLRLLHMGKPLCRTPGIMGYFTDSQMGLSTRQGGRLSHIEMNVVQKRYGIHDKIKWELIKESNRYRYDQYFFNEEWHSVINWVPDYGKPLLPWPVVWVSSFFRNVPRLLLEQLGLWEAFLKIKDGILRRGKMRQ